MRVEAAVSGYVYANILLCRKMVPISREHVMGLFMVWHFDEKTWWVSFALTLFASLLILPKIQKVIKFYNVNLICI